MRGRKRTKDPLAPTVVSHNKELYRERRSLTGPNKVTLEKQFERAFAGALKQLNIYSVHIRNTISAGTPDRYVASGNWIEFKSIAIAENPVKLDVKGVMSQWQCRRAEILTRGGDAVWLAILLHSNGEKFIYFERWGVASRDNFAKAKQEGRIYPYSKMIEVIKHAFRK